jgi:adenylylsulfate kinase-like enzyme
VTGLRESSHAAETAEWAPYAQARAAARQALGEARFAEAYSAGRALSAEQAIAYALEVTATPS